MIEVNELVKRYGDTTAVDHLSFAVEPGRITGFLGPNGAGKSTTMRLILGLDRPSSGTALIDGKPYRDLADPLRAVGALLEARAVHPGRTAFNHLLYLAQTQGVPRSRISEVLELVGLSEVAKKRTKGFSLGMGQRLGIAAALLGNPRLLILDEPVNGLDPEGILWIRTLLKQLAAEGRTVFVSSHLMNEMAVTADHVVVIGRGKLIANTPMDEFIARYSENMVLVRSPQAGQLAEVLRGGNVTDGDAGGVVKVTAQPDGALLVNGIGAPAIGEAAAARGIVLHELSPQRGSLEEAFMELTRGDVQFHAPTAGAPGGAGGPGAPGAPGWGAAPGTAPGAPGSQQDPWAVSEGSPR
jgi:ABC-2 type transport system ATP-binding protein